MKTLLDELEPLILKCVEEAPATIFTRTMVANLIMEMPPARLKTTAEWKEWLTSKPALYKDAFELNASASMPVAANYRWKTSLKKKLSIPRGDMVRMLVDCANYEEVTTMITQFEKQLRAFFRKQTNNRECLPLAMMAEPLLDSAPEAEGLVVIQLVVGDPERMEFPYEEVLAIFQNLMLRPNDLSRALASRVIPNLIRHMEELIAQRNRLVAARTPAPDHVANILSAAQAEEDDEDDEEESDPPEEDDEEDEP